MRLPAVLLCLALLAATAAAEDLKTVAKTEYAAVDHSFVKRDIKATEAAMRPRITSDFRAVVGGRSVTYEAVLSNFRGMFAAFARIESANTKIQKIQIRGDSGTLTVLSTLTAYAKGHDGKMHRFDLSNTSADVWKRVKGAWKCATTTTISESMKMDGKLLPQRRLTG